MEIWKSSRTQAVFPPVETAPDAPIAMQHSCARHGFPERDAHRIQSARVDLDGDGGGWGASGVPSEADIPQKKPRKMNAFVFLSHYCTQ